MDRVSQQGADELVVPYDAGPAQERAERWRRMLRGRLLSLGISVVVLIVVFVWQHERLAENPAPTFIVYGLILLAGVGWVVGLWIGYRRAKRIADASGAGTALRISRWGIELAGQPIGWPQLARLGTVKGSWPGGPLLQATRTDGSTVAVPLEQLPVLPATLDSTVRAYSGGRFGVDLSELDA